MKAAPHFDDNTGFFQSDVRNQLVNPLLDFFAASSRDLPWRRTRDPYKIWVSEIMLQQTRVETVIPYYERFTAIFPDVASLAAAEDEPLYKVWEGLGYYSRVRNMRRAARYLCSAGMDNLPRTYEELLALTGIGSYTAGAIASIAYGLPVPAVDGNVLRVMARLTNCRDNILSPGYKEYIESLLKPIIPADGSSGQFNQSLIELGALICLPNGVGSGGPKCDRCPIRSVCQAHLQHTEQVLPVRETGTKRLTQQKTVLIIYDNTRVCLRRRPETGLLSGLYEFPTLDGWLTQEEVTAYLRGHRLEPVKIVPLPEAKHEFSHREWLMRGYAVELAYDTSLPSAPEGQNLFAVSRAELDSDYPVPSAFSYFRKYLSERT